MRKVMGEQEREPEENISFLYLAAVYPREAYAAAPERFWELFQEECPGVSREEMERLLEEAVVG